MLPTTIRGLLAAVLVLCHCHLLGCMGVAYFPDENNGGGLLYSWVDLWLAPQSLLYFLHQYHPEEMHSRSLHRHFGYSKHDGPNVWALEWPMCGGYNQSPINLQSDSIYRLKVRKNLSWRGYHIPPHSMTLTNNGHTVEVRGNWGGAELTPSISDGPLHGVYQFSQLHFHWGTENHFGSEHTVNNHGFPMEMHVVHFKREYGSQAEAAKHKDGLAVVAFLFQLSDISNPGLDSIIPWMDHVVGVQQSIVLPHTFSLDMFNITFPKEYISYFGSLTTPPCSEVVTWIVSSTSLTVSPAQLERFRRVSAAHSSMENNFRPVQPLNGRSVYYIS